MLLQRQNPVLKWKDLGAVFNNRCSSAKHDWGVILQKPVAKVNVSARMFADMFTRSYLIIRQLTVLFKKERGLVID